MRYEYEYDILYFTPTWIRVLGEVTLRLLQHKDFFSEDAYHGAYTESVVSGYPTCIWGGADLLHDPLNPGLVVGHDQ